MEATILLIEDEPLARKGIKSVLELDGYLVICHYDGQKAIDDIREGLKYDLAIIDLSLPKVGGDEIIRVSKQLNPHIPILSMSGYNHTPKGSNCHFTKPIINVEGLEKAIEAHLSKKVLSK